MPKDKTQREKFEEAARAHETDDREETFDAALKKIAKATRDDAKRPARKQEN